MPTDVCKCLPLSHNGFAIGGEKGNNRNVVKKENPPTCWLCGGPAKTDPQGSDWQRLCLGCFRLENDCICRPVDSDLVILTEKGKEAK